MVKINLDLDGVKIPKKVAGMKVPKKLRKQGKKLIAKANSPEGREAIAAGLAIVGTAIATKARVKAERAAAEASHHAEAAANRAAAAGERARAKVIRHPSANPSAPGEPGIDPAADLGDAIAAGISALQRFMGNPRRD